jgi:STE24 endopeptidase
VPIVLALSYLALTAIRIALSSLNLAHLRRHGAELPPEFEGVLDRATLERSARYTVERTRVGVISSVLWSLVVLAFVFGGGLAAYDRAVASVTGSFVGSGVIFFVGLGLIAGVVELPLSAYTAFVIEARYGFNRMTPRLFVMDWLKSTAIGAVISALLSAGALALVNAAPDFYWLWAWTFFSIFSVFLIFVSPYLIEPLFFKMKPLGAPDLVVEVKAMARRVGVELERVLEVDASRRSSHSNAYFTGLGRTKRVVLFDTLLERMNRSEIVAVLAHELGHWKLGHILKRLIATELSALVGIYLASVAIAWNGLPALVGLGEASFAARAVIVGFIASIPSFFLTPLSARWSRDHEREADDFARQLTGTPGELASALLKLSRDNLANLHPHPLYAAFYYSHPPVIQRVRRLRLS